MSRFEDIEARIRSFSEERDWDQFHSPKNLSMALSVEVAELLEHFQWLTEDQTRALNPEAVEKVSEEIADVFIYLARLSDKLEVDLLNAVEKKIAKNALKYPIEKARGNSVKYDRL